MGNDPMVPDRERFLDKALSKHTDPSARLLIFQREIRLKEKSQKFVEEWEKSQKKDEDLENRPEKTADVYASSGFSHFTGPTPEDRIERAFRFWRHRRFREIYDFVEGVKVYMDDKVHIVQRSVKCFASAWAAVHGCHSVCMVTSRDMDMTHFPAFYQRDCMKQQNLKCLAAAVISEVECIPYEDAHYHDPALHEYCAGRVESSFCVVSAGGLERDLVEGMDFSCIKDWSTFKSDTESHDGTIQAAIRAYEHLLGRVVVEAEDIWVTVMTLKYCNLADLPIDIIKKHLAMVNGSSTKAPIKALTRKLGESSDARLVHKFSRHA